MNVKSLVRPLVRELQPYVPGEQPRIKGLVKLNTNENPYPPSPKVLRAVQAATDQRLRLYPNPTADGLRAKLARLHGCATENIIVGNGSDELLALATRAFVEPADALAPKPPGSAGAESGRDHPELRARLAPLNHQGHTPLPALSPLGGERVAAGRERGGSWSGAVRFVERQLSARTVQYFNPSYSLYPVLADIAGAVRNPVPLGACFNLPSVAELRRGGRWNFHAGLSFVTTPNAPSGRGFPTADLDALCQAQQGVLVLDEAYVDFAEENAMGLARRHPHVLVARTFSKAYSLCFQRVGYFVGSAVLIEALHKLRDSYNVNGLGQVAAAATLEDLPHYRRTFRKVIATRERLSRELAALGFEVLPSQTNFVLARPPHLSAREWLERWRARKILVRWWAYPEVKDYLRISVGTDREIDLLLRAAKGILSK
jgi:histidinol-phosphate aminotransferase